MPTVGVSRLAKMIVVLSVSASWTARAAAPNSCTFLTTAAVSAALGKPVTGGTMSMVDHQGASASSCSYMAGTTIVVFSVDERGTAAEAMKEYANQLDNSHIRTERQKGSSDEQKTILEPGIGEGAFSEDMINGSTLGITAVHGSRVFLIGIMNAPSIAHERVRSLMQSAIRH